jgi:DNA-directed RNA polymerase subunit RPC12/RpoP
MDKTEKIKILMNSLDQIAPCPGCGMRWGTGDYECPHCGKDLEDNLFRWSEAVINKISNE